MRGMVFITPAASISKHRILCLAPRRSPEDPDVAYDARHGVMQFPQCGIVARGAFQANRAL